MVESLRDSQDNDSAPLGVGGSIALAIRWGGAALSIGLVLGVVYWAFLLGVRDASEVPVIRAMEGDARITPDDPGGAQAEHQGLAVNDVLANEEPAEIDTETALAPTAQTPAEEDVTLTDLEAEAELSTTQPAEPMRVEASQLLVEILPDEPEETPVVDEDTNSEPSVAADGMTMPLRRPDSIIPRVDAPDAELDGIIDSLIEDALPEEGGTSLELPEPAAPPPPFNNPVLDPGAALIQLGAFDTLERAADAWILYQNAHGDLIAGLDRHIEEIEAGGRLLFILRGAGFDDLNETQAMCAALSARDVECISATLQ